MIRYPEVSMGFRSLARSLLVTASIAAAAATPVFAQQPTPSQANPAAPAPAAPAPAPQQPNAASPKVEPATPGQTQPQAPGTVKSNHGAWSVVCDKPAGASAEQCALMQNVIAEDRPEVGLSVVVLKTADRKSKILRVLAPLGVLLPNGLGLNVDGKDIGRAYFVRCFADGCYAEVVLEDELLKTFRSGAQATFIVFQTPEEGIGIPVDLKGFAEGFDALP
ncbi:invasion associated locus B family protein [Rhizobium lentis]|uniref:Invasion associated locus B family protein n=1 Tax=Rhizobium lentis TaxID=1138194 RepID=A0A9Q3MH14_9HYPH|nr:invasion associated locus B family protein [Rhizobium lentis]MBX4959362.1 invasion associated locus B family protein [Rhizobium lentis]MBX4977687.1 invasion associated locus B family protein [Rhizobium lentis]MBX4989497.1 invasion associated locus B family protein [Rhizobium lentis]MBX4999168.1 invasion associated locus B family protein [Rhizobium lentis]MBX5007817.1 invasion associated locus B family protein [Rhizobium lentis]